MDQHLERDRFRGRSPSAGLSVVSAQRRFAAVLGRRLSAILGIVVRDAGYEVECHTGSLTKRVASDLYKRHVRGLHWQTPLPTNIPIIS